jgi:1-acyl-sn-glycerol-3-phosphate acyltransferase
MKNFKLCLIVLVSLMQVLQYHIFSFKISKIFYILIVSCVVFLMNPQIKIHGNVNNFQNNKLLIMSNHYDGFSDGNIIYNLYYKHNSIETLHTIVKSDLVGTPGEDKQKILQYLSPLKKALIKSLYFIPYKRGDKEDGNNVKNIITESLNEGKNILVFPEGGTHKDGIPKDFKNGIFHLAVENKIRILPITIKYKKDIGTEKKDPINYLNLFDNDVDLYIHDIIDETDQCYRTNDPLALKQKTFDIIKAPMMV